MNKDETENEKEQNTSKSARNIAISFKSQSAKVARRSIITDRKLRVIKINTHQTH